MTKIKTKKKFGQHFLINEELASDITKKLIYKDNVIEIGPGKGVLTKNLFPKKVTNLVVSEIDRDLVAYLSLKFPSLKIISGDILTLDFNIIYKKKFSIIGNLPYNISSQILFKILDNRDKIVEFVIMLQKEVAERICSTYNKKSYGILSVLTQTYYDLTLSEPILPYNFDPPPRVDSCVIHAVRNNNIDIGINYYKFKNIVKNCFQNRRKTLRNSLKNLNLPKEFTSSDIFSSRAEQLKLNDFIWLSKEINKINNEVRTNK